MQYLKMGVLLSLYSFYGGYILLSVLIITLKISLFTIFPSNKKII